MFVNLNSIQLKNLEDKDIQHIIKRQQKKIFPIPAQAVRMV
jgi:hypothetical protein